MLTQCSIGLVCTTTLAVVCWHHVGITIKIWTIPKGSQVSVLPPLQMKQCLTSKDYVNHLQQCCNEQHQRSQVWVYYF